MKRSDNRVLTTHVGSLPRPDGLRQLLVARDDGLPYDPAAFEAAVTDAVHEAIQLQVAHAIDIVNDGEQSKRSWSTYARERLGGHEPRPRPEGYQSYSIFTRDAADFAAYFEVFGPDAARTRAAASPPAAPGRAPTPASRR